MDPLILHRVLKAEFSIYGYDIEFIVRKNNELMHPAITYMVRVIDGGKEGLTIGYDDDRMTIVPWFRTPIIVLSYADPLLLSCIRQFLAYGRPMYQVKKKICDIEPVIAFDPTRDLLKAV